MTVIFIQKKKCSIQYWLFARLWRARFGPGVSYFWPPSIHRKFWRHDITVYRWILYPIRKKKESSPGRRSTVSSVLFLSLGLVICHCYYHLFLSGNRRKHHNIVLAYRLVVVNGTRRQFPSEASAIGGYT